MKMKKELKKIKKEMRDILRKNAKYPGYGCCSKCGGNWGWKKTKTHMTSKSKGLFLFCEECDKTVTAEERWKALDEWKARCISQILGGRSLQRVIEIVNEIENTEFIEFPREV